jgi:hypothetical protein
MLLSVVEAATLAAASRGGLVTRQLVEIRIPTTLLNKMEGQARPQMCVILSPIPLNPRLTLDIEVVLDLDHLESEDEILTGTRRRVSQAGLRSRKWPQNRERRSIMTRTKTTNMTRILGRASTRIRGRIEGCDEKS